LDQLRAGASPTADSRADGVRPAAFGGPAPLDFKPNAMDGRGSGGSRDQGLPYPMAGKTRTPPPLPPGEESPYDDSGRWGLPWVPEPNMFGLPADKLQSLLWLLLAVAGTSLAAGSARLYMKPEQKRAPRPVTLW